MDFTWLNEVPADRFQPSDDGQWYLAMPTHEFMQRSGARENDRWRETLDSWGASQPRAYVGIAVPGPPGVPFFWVMATLDRPHPRG